jgi:hypothetical protein
MTALDVIEGRARWHVAHSEALAFLRALPDACVDAVATDPPAGIAFMGKAWDGDRGGRAQWVAWLAEILAECRRVLKPGGHALVWALPRTSHWTATAIEDAGFAVVDVGVHLFGGGWPKSTGLLKPAAEHWIVARKGRGAALQTEACRVDAGEGRPLVTPTRTAGSVNSYNARVSGGTTAGNAKTALGRWPANVTLEHEPECDHSACVASCAAAALDAQSGELESRPMRAGTLRRNLGSYSGGFAPAHATERDIDGDRGGASRFFYCSKARGEEARGRGNTHPTVKPVALMRWLCRLVTPPNGVVLDCFVGSGTTLVACAEEGFRFVGCEREAEYHAIAEARGRAATRQVTLFERAAAKRAEPDAPAQLGLLDRASGGTR